MLRKTLHCGIRLFSQHTNHYRTLSINEDATFEEVKRKYLEQSKKVHPDSEGGSQQQFIALKEAYETLIDPQERKKYDLSLGINSSLWQSSEYSLSNPDFQNQKQFDQIASMKAKSFRIKTSQEILMQRYAKELAENKFNYSGFIVPGLVLGGFWVIWERVESVVREYEGGREYASKESEHGKKLSSFVAEIR